MSLTCPPGHDIADSFPLKTISANTLNASGSTTGSGLKRKSRPNEKEERLKLPYDSIQILPHDGNTKQTRTLYPKLLVSRNRIPLAFIAADRSGQSATHRLFFAKVEALEPPHVCTDEELDLPVLIVEQDHDGSLAAVERVEGGSTRYLGLGTGYHWKTFSRKPAKLRRLNRPSSTLPKQEGNEWWSNAAVKVETSHAGLGLSNSLPKISISMKPPVSSKRQLDTSNYGLEHNPNPQSDELAVNASIIPSTEDLLATIRTQYMDALYITRTSLAYFAKGPLSRARAAYRQDSTSCKPSELIEFLRASVLPVATNDKKYSATLPELIKEIPAGITPDEEDSIVMSHMADTIKKSKKRKKISKGGLLPQEEEYVLRWWILKDDATSYGGAEDTRERRIKRAITEQRARETQLQIILILEVLALEAVPSQEPEGEHEIKPVEGQEIKKPQTPAKKAKKAQNLSLLLDLLIDRLCIWETMGQDDVLAAEKDISKSDIKGENGSSNDKLKDFCTGVIVPFFAARLPELCASLSKNSGAAAATSPRTQPAPKALPKPGSAISRPQLKKVRKPLERVLSEDAMATRRPLSRSVTDSFVPALKQELGDVSLSSVPMHRPTLQESRRYSQREVDLPAISQATKAKLQKKAAIERELQGAIDALKKPNARMAVKEYVDSVDQRSTTSKRKSKNPVRNVLAAGVQVMATPKAGRHRHSYPEPAQHSIYGPEPSVVPASSDPRIPSSTIRPTVSSLSVAKPISNSHTPNKHLPPKHRLFPSLDATPSRRKLTKSKSSSSLLTSTSIIDDNEDELAQPSPELPRLKPPTHGFKRPSLPTAGVERTPNRSLQFIGKARKDKLVATTPTKSNNLRGSSIYPITHGSLAGVLDTPVHRRTSDTIDSTPTAKRTQLSPEPTIFKPTPLTKLGRIAQEEGHDQDNINLIPASSPPLAAGNISQLPTSTPPIPAIATTLEEEKEQEELQEKSIYEALGWDDEDDLI